MSDAPDITPAATDVNDGAADDQSTDVNDQNTDDNVDDVSSDTDAGDAGSESDDGGDAGDAGEGGQNDVPESYADFDVPEGVTIDEKALEAAIPVFKDIGLTQEQAQKVVNLQAGLVQAAQQEQVDAFNRLKSDWVDQSKADKEIGGEAFDANVGLARKAIDQFGTPELSELLDQYGVGNHPEMIRFAMRVGATLKEDVPGGNASESSKPQDRVSLLYPSDN